MRLLEEEIGEPLFNRVGRRLVLNNKGAVLLASVRDSMRIVSDAVDEVTSTVMSGPVRIASPGSFMYIFVLPALRLLKQRHAQLRPILASVNPVEVTGHLLTGALDMVLTDQELQIGDELIADMLLRVAYSVYCGPGHPLYDRDEAPIDLATIQQYEFIAPPGGGDHWPSHHERTIGVQTTVLGTGVDLCGSGDFLAVLPEVVAEAPRTSGPLRRLPFDVCPPVPMYAIYRRAVTEKSSQRQTPAGAALQAIRDSIASAE